MAGIFWLSSQSVVPGASIIPDWLNYDWLHHGTAYAGLAMVVVRALAGGRLRAVGTASLVGAWTIATVYGFTDEFHQSFVPNRNTDPKDVLVDFLGATAGSLAAMRFMDWRTVAASGSSDADQDRPAGESS